MLNIRFVIPVFMIVLFVACGSFMPKIHAHSIEETYELARSLIKPTSEAGLPVAELPLILSEEEKDAVTRTIWGEARNQSMDGKIAVAEVILQRVRQSRRSPKKVVQARYQFSCWNRRDPNRRKMLKLSKKNTGYKEARDALEIALKGTKTITKGATHYHTKSVKPRWARGQKPVVTIGRHHFYSIKA